MSDQLLERTPAPDTAAGIATGFLVVDGATVIARLNSADSAIARATRRLRELIEQDRFGTIKIVDPSGRVLWRESAAC
ncbi:MAG: hypothetical protein HY060_16465 [Proteobacteria bacterium]|nr:hypothetical protein [Pseudomonadota bacterium]